jgi:hypothetical protein
MLLTSIRVEGLRAAPSVEIADPGVVCRLPSDPQGAVVADGLALLGAALRPDGATGTLAALDLAGPDTTQLLDEALLDEVEQLDPDGVAALVAPAANRHVTITVGLRPDPPMFRRLRDVAARDPGLLSALATGADLQLRVGWLFNRAGTHASVGVLAVHVGEERFATARADRPAWLLDVLADVGARLLRVDGRRDEAALAEALLAAALSPDPARRASWERAREVLASPPFSLGALHLVQARPHRLRLAFGADLVPLRALGPAALEAVRLVHAAIVERPDVLVADALVPGAEDWLGTLVEGDDATLEQALVVHVRAAG